MNVYYLDNIIKLSQQPSWGVGMIVGEHVHIYQKSLYWLITNGLDHKVASPYRFIRNNSLYSNSQEIVYSSISLSAVKSFFEFIGQKFYLEEDAISWPIENKVSDVFYEVWLSSANDENEDFMKKVS